MRLYELTAHKLLEIYNKNEATPTDVVKSLFERIDEIEQDVGVFVYLDRERILARAKHLESQNTRHGRLWGVPVAIKDNICVKDELTTCASNILAGFKPPYNATVVERLESEGAVLFGKTNMDEFAFGSSTENSCYKITRNPWDKARVPGGSSGGSAAGVSAALTISALGSDTGGSIRQPASLCGVVGLKPTYGRVSRYGLVAFASSLDQIGPITKDITDCALLLNVIAGYDEMDSTSAPVEKKEWASLLDKDIKGLKIGIPKEYFIEGIDREVDIVIQEAIKTLKGLGAECVDISLPHTGYGIAVYYIIATAEASSNLARFDGVRYGFRVQSQESRVGSLEPRAKSQLLDMYEYTRANGFGDEAIRRVILGTYVLSHGYYEAYYLRALKVRTLIKQDFDRAFKDCDCILTPTSPTTAFRIGEKTDDPLKMYLSDIFTITANLAGLPALAVPCGFTKDGLPVGLQLTGKPFDEETLFRAGFKYEQATPWNCKKPKL